MFFLFDPLHFRVPVCWWRCQFSCSRTNRRISKNGFWNIFCGLYGKCCIIRVDAVWPTASTFMQNFSDKGRKIFFGSSAYGSGVLIPDKNLKKLLFRSPPAILFPVLPHSTVISEKIQPLEDFIFLAVHWWQRHKLTAIAPARQFKMRNQ